MTPLNRVTELRERVASDMLLVYVFVHLLFFLEISAKVVPGASYQLARTNYPSRDPQLHRQLHHSDLEYRREPQEPAHEESNHSRKARNLSVGMTSPLRVASKVRISLSCQLMQEATE